MQREISSRLGCMELAKLGLNGVGGGMAQLLGCLNSSLWHDPSRCRRRQHCNMHQHSDV
jgi:hypothetical protein